MHAMHISLEDAGEADAEALTEVSQQAFHSDVRFGGDEQSGPVGYDSIEWQKEAMGTHTAYLKIVVGGKLA